MSETKETISQWVDDCESEAESRNTSFTKWEISFAQSVAVQWRESEFLTERQLETLKALWEKI